MAQSFGIRRILLSIAVLLFFMTVNLRGARASGEAEDLIVYAKIIILAVFGVIGLTDPAHYRA